MCCEVASCSELGCSGPLALSTGLDPQSWGIWGPPGQRASLWFWVAAPGMPSWFCWGRTQGHGEWGVCSWTQSGPSPPGAQSGPPTLVDSEWAPHPPVLSGPPGLCLGPGPVVGSPVGSVVRRPPAPCQLVPGRVMVLVLTCGLFCVCTCVLAASAFSVSFGSDTRYSSLFSSAPAGPPSPVSSLLSPLMSAPLPARPPVPAVLPSSLWVCLLVVPGTGPALSAASPVAQMPRRWGDAFAALPSIPLGGAGRVGACAAPRLR